MNLEETGQEKWVIIDWLKTKVKVIMTIKAPKGICQIYDIPHDHGYCASWNSRAEAVRAFMKEHNVRTRIFKRT